MSETEAAQKCAEIYTAIAAGKTVLVDVRGKGSLQPYNTHIGPTVFRIRTGWKFLIKEDAPGFMWAIRSKSDPACFTCTDKIATALEWGKQGEHVEVYSHEGTHFRTGEVGRFIPAPKSHESEERGKL